MDKYLSRMNGDMQFQQHINISNKHYLIKYNIVDANKEDYTSGDTKTK